MKLNTAVSALSLAAALTLSATGYARNPNAAAPSVTVRYSQQDLQSIPGIQSLYQKIQNAALHVCWQVAPEGVDSARCRRSLTATAVDEVNSPALTALHAGRIASGMTAGR